MKGNKMQITLNFNPKLLAKLASQYELEISDLESNIVEYFKAYENDELLEELITDTIINY